MSEESTNNGPPKRKQRKRTKNFLANAKKYAKKGQMGRGTKISEELYQYFVGILDSIKAGIQGDDARIALVNNVLERTKEIELEIIGNQLGCRVIEMLLPNASEADLERFMDILSPELRKLCSDNFSSHVVETLLKVACDRATDHLQGNKSNGFDSDDEAPKKKAKLEISEANYSKTHIKACHDFTIKICKYTLNNLEDFVWDSYANHILRSSLKCLSGITLLPGEKPKVNLFKIPVHEKKGIPPIVRKLDYKYVPDEFKELVTEFGKRLSAWPQFKDLPYENLTSGLLQVLLYAVKNADKTLTKNLITQLLNESFAPEGWQDSVTNEDEEKKDVKMESQPEKTEIDNSDLPPVFHCEAAVRLLEASLFVAKKKTYTQLYARCFINRLGRLALVPYLNFPVQRLLDQCSVKEELEPMFEELSDKFGAILLSSNTGVLVALAKACLRLQTKQMQFINNLEAALECNTEATQKYFPMLCLRLRPLSKVEVASLDQNYYINIHGSVIMQTILDFQRPAKAVQGLLELTPEQLLYILCDPKGCHVGDALCSGRCVGVKARDKLLWRLKGYYQKLALSQYGSRAFEKIFEAASIEQKVKIMTEISDKSNLLNSTNYGRLIATKLDVAAFKESQKKWEGKWNKKSEKEKIKE